MPANIRDTGISTVHEPKTGAPSVDIVIIHGLQGHPYRTWAFIKGSKNRAGFRNLRQNAPDHEEKDKATARIRRSSRQLMWRGFRQGSDKHRATRAVGDGDGQQSSVFWPADLLPIECPNARILMYGYGTQVTKYMAGAPNKSSIFSHSKDLLFELSRKRPVGRPLIFVAHSLGGIVVKEMLSRSEASTEPVHSDIIRSTAAVVFLGTPHRGSPELAALGEWVRTLVSTLRMETNSAILDALGLKNTDLERAQEAFSALWQRYNFQVKTFQEGHGLTGINLGVLGNKVVPHQSSLIGDQREHAETIEANHMDMCRFSGPEDCNYRKVAEELHSLYLSILNISRPTQSESPRRLETSNETHCEVIKAYLQSLWFPGLQAQLRNFDKPAEGTCQWLFKHRLYQDWLNNDNENEHSGLLWLKGHPGSGKTTLMKEAFRRHVSSSYCTAAYFFSSKGDDFERSRNGLFRSLLYQLLPGHAEQLQNLALDWYSHQRPLDASVSYMQECFRKLVLSLPPSRRVYIFIDALDEADFDNMRCETYFWRTFTIEARRKKIMLNVTISSRHFPSITISDCPEIIVENHNGQDIASYVDQKLTISIAAKEPQWQLLREKILAQSTGVFLWVVLVLNEMLVGWDEGKSVRSLLNQLDVVPTTLWRLYTEMFMSLEPDVKQLTIQLFQWALLSVKPLRLHEWHHILAFIKNPNLASLHDWRCSENFTENDGQLERAIRSISKGLVAVKTVVDDGEPGSGGFETTSICAKAGSLDLEYGESRVVQVVHRSVREFFFASNGFGLLDPTLATNPVGHAHLSIMATCLDYLDITELDALVQARSQPNRSEIHKRSQRFYNFTSSGSMLSSSMFVDQAEQDGSTNGREGKAPSHVTPSLFRPLQSTGTQSIPSSCSGASELNYSSPMRKELCVRDSSTFEWLRNSSADASIDIPRWREMNEPGAPQIYLDRPPQSSTTTPSATHESQVLEDYPALLSYASHMLFVHSRFAQYDGVDILPIITRLVGQKTWARLVALREDIPQGTDFCSFLADEGIHSCIHNGTGHICQAQALGIFPQTLNEKEDSTASSPAQNNKRTISNVGGNARGSPKRVRRQRSVASFGSAGSHDGQTHKDGFNSFGESSSENSMDILKTMTSWIEIRGRQPTLGKLQDHRDPQSLP